MTPLEFCIASRAEPLFVRDLLEAKALVVSNFEITKLANNLFIFSIIVFANIAMLRESAN